MKTKKEIQQWLQNLPKAEKAKRMFLIKKRQKADSDTLKGENEE